MLVLRDRLWHLIGAFRVRLLARACERAVPADGGM